MISYKKIGLLILAFILGIITFLIFQNIAKQEIITISTIELIGFISSLVLSTTSVVLAVTAINLGKSSEKIIIERNDKSIEQQNQIFNQTISVLQKIASSTGVTEKRIEDIIAGRTGNLTNRLVRDKIISPEKGSELKNKLDRKISSSLSVEDSEKEIEKINKEISRLEKVIEYYNDYSKTVLNGLANSKEIKVLKIGEGEFKGKKDNLVDGYFKYKEIKFGVCLLLDFDIVDDEKDKDLNTFINNLIQEIENGYFNEIYFIFNKKGTEYNKLSNIISRNKNNSNSEMFDKIEILIGEEDEILEKIKKAIKN